MMSLPRKPIVDIQPRTPCSPGCSGRLAGPSSSRRPTGPPSSRRNRRSRPCYTKKK